ncbi:unnamed protein product, partial [Ectocarpus fasciculatus]
RTHFSPNPLRLYAARRPPVSRSFPPRCWGCGPSAAGTTFLTGVLASFASTRTGVMTCLPLQSAPSPVVEDQATIAQRAKQEAHNDRIVATFNSVMLADGLKVLKHHRRSSKKAASRVIRFVPDYGGALVWDKPLRQPGAKASRVPLDAITQVELEARIVWISAGDERVGFETSKTEDADLMYQAICILVDRCHA